MQWHTEPETLFDVSPGCFIPRPEVTSSVVRLRRRAAPPVSVRDPERMMAVIRAAFGQRRKTLCNALCNGLGLDRGTVERAIRACGLDGRVRGEALRLDQFAALSDRLGHERADP